VIFEIWNATSANLVDSYPTEAEAWDALVALAEAHGIGYLTRLALAREDDQGMTTALAVGQELVDQIRAHSGWTATDFERLLRPFAYRLELSSRQGLRVISGTAAQAQELALP
jgi:hypothetical protein